MEVDQSEKEEVAPVGSATVGSSAPSAPPRPPSPTTPSPPRPGHPSSASDMDLSPLRMVTPAAQPVEGLTGLTVAPWAGVDSDVPRTTATGASVSIPSPPDSGPTASATTTDLSIQSLLQQPESSQPPNVLPMLDLYQDDQPAPQTPGKRSRSSPNLEEEEPRKSARIGGELPLPEVDAPAEAPTAKPKRKSSRNVAAKTPGPPPVPSRTESLGTGVAERLRGSASETNAIAGPSSGGTRNAAAGPSSGRGKGRGRGGAPDTSGTTQLKRLQEQMKKKK